MQGFSPMDYIIKTISVLCVVAGLLLASSEGPLWPWLNIGGVLMSLAIISLGGLRSE